jgi:hypothetical protein
VRFKTAEVHTQGCWPTHAHVSFLCRCSDGQRRPR